MFKKQQLPDINQYRYQFLYPDSSSTINTSTGTQSGSLCISELWNSKKHLQDATCFSILFLISESCNFIYFQHELQSCGCFAVAVLLNVSSCDSFKALCFTSLVNTSFSMLSPSLLRSRPAIKNILFTLLPTYRFYAPRLWNNLSREIRSADLCQISSKKYF